MRLALLALIITCGIVARFWIQSESDHDLSTPTLTIDTPNKDLLSLSKEDAVFGKKEGSKVGQNPVQLAKFTEKKAQNAKDEDFALTTANPFAEEELLGDKTKPESSHVSILKSYKSGESRTNLATKTNPIAATLATLFEKTIPESEYFKFDPSMDNVLKSKRGTLLSIPKNTFVKADKSLVTETIQLELKELLTTAEMLLANIPTTSNHGLLQSDGTFWLEAHTKNGVPLQIAPKSSIYIEQPTHKRRSNMWSFYGGKDRNKGLEWIAYQRQTNSLIPLGLKNVFDVSDKTKQDFHNQIVRPEFENTYLATREFKKRWNEIDKNKHLYEDDIQDIVKLYVTNVSKNLCEVDALVEKYLAKLAQKASHTNHKTATELQAVAKRFGYYADERLEKTVSKNKINWEIHSKNLQRTLYLSNNSLTIWNTTKAAKNTLLIHQMGWVGVDRFYKYKTAKRKLTIELADQNYQTFDNTAIYIAFKNFKSIIAVQKNKQGTYLVKGLPKDETIYIIGLGYNPQQEQTYTDVVTLNIGQQKIATLTMEPTNLDMLQYQIQQLN